jgi:FeS assembly SUF system protein
MRDARLARFRGGAEKRRDRRDGEDRVAIMSIEDDPFAFQNYPAPAGEAGGAPADGPHEPERPSSTETNEELLPSVLEALKTVRDPEIPVNLVDLGLIYELIVNKDGIVYIEMTLTAPSCPVAGELPGQVKEAIEAVDGVNDVRVKLVWSPPWDKDRMSEEAKLELGLI